MDLKVPYIDADKIASLTKNMLSISDDERVVRSILFALTIVERYIRFKSFRLQNEELLTRIEKYEEFLESPEADFEVVTAVKKGFALFNDLTKAFIEAKKDQKFFDQLKIEYSNQVADYFDIISEIVMEENEFSKIQLSNMSPGIEGDSPTLWQQISGYAKEKSDEAENYVAEKTAKYFSEQISQEVKKIKTKAKYAAIGVGLGLAFALAATYRIRY